MHCDRDTDRHPGRCHMGVCNDRGAGMQQIHYWVLSVAGGVFVLYASYLMTMAQWEFIASIPCAFMLGDMVAPRKAKE